MYFSSHIRVLLAVVCIWLLPAGHAAAREHNNRYTDSLLGELAKTKQDTARIDILLSIAKAYRPDSVVKEFYYANEALSLAERLHWDKGKMIAHQLIGESYSKVLAFNNALVHFKLSIAEAKKLNRKDVEARTLHFMFHAHHGTKDLEAALLYQKRLVDLTRELKDPLDECNQVRAYGQCLTELDRDNEGIAWFKEDIAFVQTHFTGSQRLDLIADLWNTMATTYVKMKKGDSALYCLNMGLPLAIEANNYSAIAYINSTFCDLYASTGKYDSAIAYGERTVRMGEEMRNIDLQQYYCKTLSRLYEQVHQPIPALAYHKRYDSLIGIINSTQKTIDEAMQVAKINIDQQEERNELETSAHEAVRKNQQAALIASLIAIAVFIVLTIFIYRNLRQKQKANTIITQQAASLREQNAVIDKALKMKEVLLKETHHRVKNNLQLISSLLELQAANLQDEHAKSALRTAQRRVLSIATVHSQLYGSDETEAIEFSAFAGDLFASLNQAFSNEGRAVEFENRIPEIAFPLNTVVLLGVILNELITNSFKHAFKSTDTPMIRISLERTDGMYHLRYYDNGPGLPEGVFSKDTGSLGLYLVRRLSKQLKGTAIYKYDEGCIFTIIFPDAAS